MELTNRLNNNHILRTYLNMIRTAPIDVVEQLKQNLEKESKFESHRHNEILTQEFKIRLG